jgi:hypothetical protein
MRYLLLALMFVSGCATTADMPANPAAPVSTDPAPAPAPTPGIIQSDLLAAAALANSNGYPARGAVYTALAAQAAACKAAIEAAIPAAPSLPPGAGLITAAEFAAEKVATVSGIPSNVRLACSAVTLPDLMILWKP